MVFNPTKYIILGLGVLTAAFFFKEAAGSSLSQTLARTGGAGVNIGSGIGAVGAGISQFGVRALDPFFSLADLFSKFGNLFSGGSAGETVTSTTTPSIVTTGGVSYKVSSGGGLGSTRALSHGNAASIASTPSTGSTAPSTGSIGGGIAGGDTGGGGRPNPRGSGGRGRG